MLYIVYIVLSSKLFKFTGVLVTTKMTKFNYK